MQRTTVLIGLLVLILLGSGVATWWFLSPSQSNTTTPTQTTPSNQTQYSSNVSVEGQDPTLDEQAQAAKAAYEAALATDNPDNIKTYQTAVSGGYALQLWIGDSTGGQALLKYDAATSVWTIVDPGGGAWSVEGLVAFGVPSTTAAELVARMPR